MKYIKASFLGLTIISTTNVDVIAKVLLGNHDFEIKCAIHQVVYKNPPNCDEDLLKSEVINGLERLKDYFRSIVQKVFDELEKMNEQEKKQVSIQRMKDLHTKSELGTVAEICAKYGYTKSEVRKMRAEGTLEMNVNAKSALENVENYYGYR